MDEASVRITKDTTGKLKTLAASMPPSLAGMMELGGTASALIIQRTALGLDVNNQKFQDYRSGTYYAPVQKRPPGYPTPSGGRSVAKKGGRTLKSQVFDAGYGEYKIGIGHPAHVDLSVSHQMLGDIQVKAPNDHTAVLFFSDRLSAAKAHGHHFGKYPFFGLNAVTDLQSLYTQLAEQIVEAKRRAGLS